MKRKLQILIPILVLTALAAGCTARGGTVAASPETEPPAETVFLYTSTPAPTPGPTPEPTPSPTPEPTPEPTPYRPDVDISSWEFILANMEHGIGDYTPELVEVENRQQFDVRAADALRDFIAGARAEGLSVCLSSAYRSYAEQSWTYDRQTEQMGGDRAAAARIVLPPGCSEHQTGLSADITEIYYARKDASLENTAMFQWMNEHCAEYGFILRYPKDKEDITGIIYEPWHFRYVGKEAAAFIKEEGLCFEEFLALYEE